ncbi:MAG: sulfatase-like hydrolase/transferase [Puniceicoccaceae bacterium]
MKSPLLSLIVCLLLPLAFLRAAEASQQPNILLLLADDMGYGELGCYGQQEIQTPVIDALAGQGMRFTDFYAGNAVCSPSRAVLMTGKHAGHATIRGNSGYYGDHKWSRVALRKDEETVAEMLQKAGYETAFIGKWHLDDPNDPSTWAFARGFDFAVQPNWPSRFGGEQFNEDIHYYGNRERSVTYDAEANDCIDSFRTDLIIEYLDQRDREKPLFLFMSYRTPHTREQYIRDREMYADKDWSEVDRVHAARITMLDEQVGRLLNKLEEQGELDNTLVIFTSDNGPHSEGGHDYRTFNSSGGLRGYKRDLYEGGIRVPMVAVWKDRIQPGSVSSHPAGFQDIMATLAEVAGLDASTPEDSLSFLPELLGKSQPEPDYLFWELQLDGWNQALPTGGFRQAVRMDNWKAVRYGRTAPVELYDLSTDFAESTNVAAEHPQVTERMRNLLDTARYRNPWFPEGGVPQDEKARKLYSPGRE